MLKRVNDVALLESYKGLENPDILEEKPANKEDLKALSLLLFKFNAPGVAALFIGFMCALFLKERFWVELGFKFPHLVILGMSGSGKTETMNSIGIPIINMSIDQQLAAKQATAFTTLKLVSSSNLTPLIITEWKEETLSMHIRQDGKNLVNNGYDRNRGVRGQINQTVKSYQYTAPIIIIGESFEADRSAIERIIRIYLNKEDSIEQSESFLKLKSMNKTLKKLGKSILLEALSIEKETLKKWHDKNISLVEKTSIQTSRGKENICKVLCGLDILQLVYNNAGLTFKDDKLTAIKHYAIERYQDDTLEGNSNSKSAVVEVLEEIDQLAYRQSIVEERHYKILERSNELALDVKSIYEILEKEVAMRRNKLPLSQAEFTRLLKRESFFGSYKTVSLIPPGVIDGTKKPRRTYVLNMCDIEERGIILNCLTKT
ncbi:hypothetical protein RBH29_08595 [Herbivorax sp. ANBcel31]|uniref:hypothetical protein n=1 Tax=Herbivorax sp. ANBcel31 TaxID=3069754 RepID=UPI0027B82A0F|nr:hypothetical protein [Herbivorax sp. ANBcel31]MDQ2086484.1 hypothetical protein [Herbivorax sp. ANBcel31]